MSPIIYTVALDIDPDSFGIRVQAKLLMRSLIATGFKGDMLIIKNTKARIVDHPRVHEVFVPVFGEDGKCGKRLAFEAKTELWREVGVLLLPGRPVGFSDADCLFLKDPTHYFEGVADIGYVEEYRNPITRSQFTRDAGHFARTRAATKWGVNSGCIIFRRRFSEIMELWSKRYRDIGLYTDQQSWNTVVHDSDIGAEALPHEQFTFPTFITPDYRRWRHATHLHFTGSIPRCADKIRFQSGVLLGHLATAHNTETGFDRSIAQVWNPTLNQ